MVLLACRDRAEYAAAIIERHDIEARLGARFVPVLGVGAASYEPSPLARSLAPVADRPEALFEPCAATIGTDDASSNVTAYVPGDREGLLCAAAFAAFSKRPLVSLESAPGGGASSRISSVTVVASSALLTTRGTDWIRGRVHALFPGARFGVLTAGDERDLSAFVARVLERAPSPRGVADVDYAPDTRPYGIHEDGACFVPDLATMPPLGRSVAGKVLFFRGHSREYCGQRGRLCSRSVLVPDDKITCVSGLECVAESFGRSPTRDVRGDIVFLDLCSGGKFPGSLEPFRNLTTQLIEGGASAVFTSAGRYYVDELTPVLIMRLMGTGDFTLGAIAEVINAFQRQRYGTVDCVLLFGDPETIPFSDRAPLAEIERSSITLASGSNQTEELTIHITRPIPSNVEIFLLRDEAAALFIEAPYTCYRHPSAFADMQALLLRLDDRHAALIVIGGQGATGDIAFGRQPPVDLSVFSAASELVARVALLPTASTDDDPLLAANAAALGETLAQTRASAAAAVRLGCKSPAETAQLRVHQEGVENAAKELAAQHARASRKAILWSGWLESYYVERGQMDMLREALHEGDPSRRCPLHPTDPAPLLACRYRVFGAGRADDRERLECERCGVVCDVIVGAPLLWIEAPTEAHLGDVFEARVHGRSASADVPAFLGVDAFVAYIDPAKSNIKVRSCPSRVDPGDNFTIVLECLVDPEVRAHAYDLRAIVSMNGVLALASRRVLYRRH